MALIFREGVKSPPEGPFLRVGGGGFWGRNEPKKGRMRAAFLARAD